MPSAAAREPRGPLPEDEQRQLQGEIAYLRTFSNVCRTHLRAYLESLGRSIEEWERAEHKAATVAGRSGLTIHGSDNCFQQKQKWKMAGYSTFFDFGRVTQRYRNLSKWVGWVVALKAFPKYFDNR